MKYLQMHLHKNYSTDFHAKDGEWVPPGQTTLTFGGDPDKWMHPEFSFNIAKKSI